jgi:hypothetical protein
MDRRCPLARAIQPPASKIWTARMMLRKRLVERLAVMIPQGWHLQWKAGRLSAGMVIQSLGSAHVGLRMNGMAVGLR